MSIQRPSSSSASWGPRSAIGGTIKELADLRGNKDGIWGNEKQAPGTTGDAFDRNPGLEKLRAAAGVGLSATDEVRVLAEFRASVEARHGMPVLDPAVEASLNNGALFAAQKAIALERYGRTPADVTERFVSAGGSVDGVAIPESRVFSQHWKPTAPPTGDVVVMSPGFLETGRAFMEEVQLLNKAGVHVVVMDHQWAGQTQGRKGGIRNGESIALHTAAVTADAARVGRELYGDRSRVTVVGESMGGGPGALGAVLMNESGKLKLDGPSQMPRGVNLVLQAPFLGATPGLVNSALAGASHLPLLNRLAMPGIGLPDFVDDKVGEHKVSQGMVLEDIRGQLQAFSASDAFVGKMKAAITGGARPEGHVHVIHDRQDPLADPAQSDWLVSQLGARATISRLEGGDHGLSASDAQKCAEDILAVLKR